MSDAPSMAKAKLGILLEELRGKAGNAVFKRTKVGTVVSERTTPTNPNTIRQLQVRANLSKAAKAFKALSPAQVALWNAYALKIAQPGTKPRAAVDIFCALATKRLQIYSGNTIPTTPPATPFTGDSVHVTVSGVPGQIMFYSDDMNAAGVMTRTVGAAAGQLAPEAFGAWLSVEDVCSVQHHGTGVLRRRSGRVLCLRDSVCEGCHWADSCNADARLGHVGCCCSA